MTDLVAWVPLYIATVSLITISIPHILGGPSHNPRTPSHGDDIEALSPGESDGPRRSPDSPIMTRWRTESTARYHLVQDLDHTPPRASDLDSFGTTLSLSSTPGQARPSWGSHVLGFWINPLHLFHSRQQPQAHNGDGEPLDPYHDDEPHAEQNTPPPQKSGLWTAPLTSGPRGPTTRQQRHHPRIRHFWVNWPLPLWFNDESTCAPSHSVSGTRRQASCNSDHEGFV